MTQETQIRALYQPRGGDGEGDRRKVQKGGDICIPMADSCSGLTENKEFCKVIILQFKKKKKKKHTQKQTYSPNKILGWPKSSSITSYRKTQTNFLASLIFL